MRGYFLLSITLNHLYYFPSGLDPLTMRGHLFASSAEGFFFISGIVLGIVRGAKLATKPFTDIVSLLWKRTFQLYAVYAVLTIAFTLVGWWFFMDNPGIKQGIAPPDTPILTMIWNVLSFNYLYGWVDYLRLYIFFMALSPIAMWLLRRGLWWAVLAISLLVWALTPTPDWPQNVFTQPYTWQLIFFGGLVIGYHWKHIASYWRSLHVAIRRVATGSVVTLALGTLIFNTLIAFAYLVSPEFVAFADPIRAELRPYFDKEHMPLYRVGLFLVWFWAAFWFFHRFERYIVKAFGWLLLSFGTNSLYTYIMSGVIIFFVHLAIPKGDWWSNLLVSVAIVAAIWLCIRYKVLMKVIPR